MTGACAVLSVRWPVAWRNRLDRHNGHDRRDQRGQHAPGIATPQVATPQVATPVAGDTACR
jgi:hypothetical protein